MIHFKISIPAVYIKNRVYTDFLLTCISETEKLGQLMGTSFYENTIKLLVEYIEGKLNRQELVEKLLKFYPPTENIFDSSTYTKLSRCKTYACLGYSVREKIPNIRYNWCFKQNNYYDDMEKLKKQRKIFANTLKKWDNI